MMAYDQKLSFNSVSVVFLSQAGIGGHTSLFWFKIVENKAPYKWHLVICLLVAW